MALFSTHIQNFAMAEEPESSNLYREEIWWLFWGVILTAAGVIGSIIFSAWENKREERTRFLELVKDFSKELKDILSNEGSLKTKRDCETHAINYLDLMDQIAFLYKERIIPKKVGDYFDNYFSYALTMLKWIDDYDVRNKKSAKEKEADWWKLEKDEDWSDLIEWCRIHNKTDPFDDDYLPDAMLNYNRLPDEEVDKSQLLQLIREYGKELAGLIDKERTLKTKLDCETYAINYLDLMDQIAFLYKKGTIPSDIGEYFGNYLSYALTILRWYNQHVRKEEPQKESTWVDLVEWCDIHKGEIEAFDDDDLPEAMFRYNK